MDNIVFRPYKGEEEIIEIFNLIDNELSEPYGIYTYRYFMAVNPEHTIIALDNDVIIGAVVGRQTVKTPNRIKGYIAMLVVKKEYRKLGIGRKLTILLLEKMKETCTEVVLETEATNVGALALYEKLGFSRTKRLFRYYLNGSEAFRLKLWFNDNKPEQ